LPSAASPPRGSPARSAARFYEKRGWHRAHTAVNRLETADGVFEIDIWRYEKSMQR